MSKLLLNIANKKRQRPFVQLGWREWCKLPGLSVNKIKVKIDTGAKTSALHVDDITYITKKNIRYVRFLIHPIQKSHRQTVHTIAELVEHRWVKSSNGAKSLRPVIRTSIQIGDHQWPIEITLTSRDEMGFRMLLGRSGIPLRFVVNPHKSYVFKKHSKVKKLKPKAHK